MASGTARSALPQLLALWWRRDTSGTGMPSTATLSRDPRRGIPSLPESESCVRETAVTTGYTRLV